MYIEKMQKMLTLKSNLQKGFEVYEIYKWLINSYVLDFFTQEHWSKLPESWKQMINLSTDQVAELIDCEVHSKTYAFPLSILALKKLLQILNMSRVQDMIHSSLTITNDEKLMKLFWKNVKLKKRHEILVMAELCEKTAAQFECHYLVDIGSGLGHLSRLLNYGYNFQVSAIEAQVQLIEQAGVLDKQFDKVFQQKYGQRKPTRHVNMKIEPNLTSQEFLKIVQSSFEVIDENFEFGIVGLHPCGDLGPTLLRLFRQLPNVKFINIVGCCYMKLSTIKDSLIPGFPLSNFCIENKYNLCYHSREIACHAIENYIMKLYEGEYWKLKIHAFRATIEKILYEIDPQLQHKPLANVKYVEDLTFEDYLKKATAKLNIMIGPDTLEATDIQNCLKQWNSVVLFYSFRLLFAPLIESLILYDRILFLEEGGSKVNVIAGFDNKISPRMHVIQAIKMCEKDRK